MPQQIKRLIFAFASVIILFLIMQHVLRPKSFGQFGHYRALAIEENKEEEVLYAGSGKCLTCHDDIHFDKSVGYHAPLKCEMCHGPGLKHVLYAEKFKGGELPDSLKLNKPGDREDCAICHHKNAARIKILFDTIDNTLIHQVNTLKHNLMSQDNKEELKCIECHNPHQP